jgi:hypothetical protein
MNMSVQDAEKARQSIDHPGSDRKIGIAIGILVWTKARFLGVIIRTPLTGCSMSSLAC